MDVELISILTDTQPLDGLFYQFNKDINSPHVAQLFHGNAMNFYTGFCKFLPPSLISINCSALAYNRRGHDILSIRDSRNPEGGALQLTAEAIADNNYARDWLIKKGYAAPICIGHSNGGLLAAKHVATHQDTPALILLSAHIGGTDMLPLASSKGLFGSDKLPRILAMAKKMIDEEKGDHIIKLPGWYWATTPKSLLDLSQNLPHLLDEAPKISCPVLFIRGDQEPEDLYPAKRFRDNCGSSVEIVTIKNSDHFYVGTEETVIKTISKWLKKLIFT